jgi:hypothetical protein
LKCKYRVKLAKKLLAILEINPKLIVKDIDLYLHLYSSNVEAIVGWSFWTDH